MSEQRINVCSVPLGPRGLKYTPSELERRKRDVCIVIEAIAPRSRYLLHSLMEVRYSTENDQLTIYFDLIQNPQHFFNYEPGNSMKGGMWGLESALPQLCSDLVLLKDSIRETQITVSQLAQRLAQGDWSDECPDIQLLKKVMVRQRGKTFRFMVDNDENNIQMPLIPDVIPEDGERIIRSRVRGITAHKIVLSSIQEIGVAGDNIKCKLVKSKMVMLRPPNNKKPLTGLLMQIAMDANLSVDLRVKVALSADSGEAAHFELIEICNDNDLSAVLTQVYRSSK